MARNIKVKKIGSKTKTIQVRILSPQNSLA